MFQMTFAIITPALVIGGFAERMRFSAVLWFTALWLLLVYVPIAHWVWGGGWLAKLGVMDFAGGIVVHISAGVARWSARWSSAAPRLSQTAMPPHSLPLAVAGAGMLWVGWFGFNAGSALAANGSAGMAMLATHMGASAGALAWMFVGVEKYGKPRCSAWSPAWSRAWARSRRRPGSSARWARSPSASPPARVFLRHAVSEARSRSTTRSMCRPCMASAASRHAAHGVFGAVALGGAGFPVQKGIAAH